MCIPKRYDYCVDCFYVEKIDSLITCERCNDIVCLNCLNSNYNNYCTKYVIYNFKYITCLQCDFISTSQNDFSNCLTCNKTSCTNCIRNCVECLNLINNMKKINLQ